MANGGMEKFIACDMLPTMFEDLGFAKEDVL